MQDCTMQGCTRRRWKSKAMCGEHYFAHLMQIKGPCPNHPDRPIYCRGLCNSCVRKLHRQKNLTTDSIRRGTANRELGDIIDGYISRIKPVRRLIARYIRTRTYEPPVNVALAYELLVLAHEGLSEPHCRYLYAQINAGASLNERIPYLRGIAP